jgi:flagellar biosynthesis protein FlhG
VDKLFTDQAEGLRRLLGQGGLSVITVLSGERRTGKTTAVANLAVALSRAGRHVLVLDQSPRGQGVCGMLDVVPVFDLADVIAGRCQLEDIILTSADGVDVLPIGGGFERFARLSEPEQQALDAAFARLKTAVDVVLVDGVGDAPGALPMGLAASEILIVLAPDARSITQSYALVKRLAHDFGKRRFRLLVNRARSAEDALSIARNFSATTEGYLGVAVDYLGAIPHDERLVRAGTLHRTVVDAFPVAASTQQFRHLAEGVLRWPPIAGMSEFGGLMQRLVHGSRLLGACKRA